MKNNKKTAKIRSLLRFKVPFSELTEGDVLVCIKSLPKMVSSLDDFFRDNITKGKEYVLIKKKTLIYPKEKTDDVNSELVCVENDYGQKLFYGYGFFEKKEN